MPQASAKVYPNAGNSWVNAPAASLATPVSLGGPVADLQRRLSHEIAVPQPFSAPVERPDRFEIAVSSFSRLMGPALLLAGYGAVAWLIV